MATIALEGVKLYAYHGFYAEENKLGQDYELDVYVRVNINQAANQDDLFKSVNYETIYLICQSEMKKPAKLLETVVQRIAYRLNEYFEDVVGVRVKLRKLQPPLGGRVACASVAFGTGVLGDEEDQED